MKNPYAPGFWCAVVAVVLLSATYFYGIMLAHQIDTALFFLDSASALIAVLAMKQSSIATSGAATGSQDARLRRSWAS